VSTEIPRAADFERPSAGPGRRDHPAEGVGTVRQAFLNAPHALELREVPLPFPGEGEVLVRVRAALTCGTDLKTYRRGHPRVPFGPFGHEGAGDVVAVGPGVHTVGVGEAVVFLPTAPCGECGPCRTGRENLCHTLFDEMAVGAYGDVLRVPRRVVRRHVLPKPEGLSYIEAAFLEPLACVVHAWRRLGPLPGRRVAVIGLGPIGLLHVQEARRRGLEVAAVGRREGPLAQAVRAGASHAVGPSGDDPGCGLRALWPDGPDVVIECTGSEAVWRAAPSWAAGGGKVLLFGGLPGGTMPGFDATRLHYGEVDLVAAFHYGTEDVHAALALLASGQVRPAPLITGLRPLADIVEVFRDLDRGAGAKYALLPHGTEWV
jgi:L-iditol 2-dehydrogenase